MKAPKGRLIVILLSLITSISATAAENLNVPPLDLTLRPVLWQALPESVQEVSIGPDKRLWYEITPSPDIANIAAVKTIIEREFSKPAPQIVGARIVLFETGDPHTARVWFTTYDPYRLIGWDGRTWVEHDPNAGNPSRNVRELRYLRGNLPGHGARGHHNSPNLQLGDTLLFPTTDGVTTYDTRADRWSHQVLTDRKLESGLPVVPELTAMADGAAAMALAGGPEPAVWRFSAGEWKKLPDPWPAAPKPPRWIFLMQTGVWVRHSNKLLSFYTFDGRAPDGFDVLINELAADDFARREHAQRTLLAMSASARPWLENAKKTRDADSEISLRIDDVLKSMTQQDKALLGGVPVDFIDRVDAFDRHLVVTAHDQPRIGEREGKKFLFVSKGGGEFTELDAQACQGIAISNFGDSGCLATARSEQYWMPHAGPGETPALVDIRTGKLLETLPNARFRWLQSVTADGMLYVSPGEPSDAARSRPIMVYQPGKPDDRVSLPVTSVEMKEDCYCIASDGAVWAGTGKAGVSRFDDKGWTQIPETASMKDVHGLSPGAHGEILIESRAGAMMLIPGKEPLRAKLVEEIIESNRVAVAAAFPGGKCGRPSLSHFALFADPAGNIWLKRGGPWKVLTKDGWLEGQEAAIAAAGKPFQIFYLSLVGDGTPVFICGGNQPNDFAFLVRVEAGKLAFDKLPRVTHNVPFDGFVRDREGNLYLPGKQMRRVTPQGKVEDLGVTSSGEVIPTFVDQDNNLWFQDRIHGVSTELTLWRDGKIRQTVRFASVGAFTKLAADKPGSVWAWNQSGIHHLIAREGAYALERTYAQDEARAGGHVEYTALGYLTSDVYCTDRGPTDPYFRLSLVKLPK